MKFTPTVFGIAMLITAALGNIGPDEDDGYYRRRLSPALPESCPEGLQICNQPGGTHVMRCNQWGRWRWDRPCREGERCYEIGEKAGCLKNKVLLDAPCSEMQLSCNELGGSYIMRCIGGKLAWEESCPGIKRCFEYDDKAADNGSKKVVCL
jgi:hypothetical protein